MRMQSAENDYKAIQFKSLDGLSITADLYLASKAKAFILLCHRSHCNRGEFRQTARTLSNHGFSCLAIDQRSGMTVFGVVNETSALAKKKAVPTGYLDAKPDIEAAVDHAYEMNDKRPIVILGSSYSASLALLISAHSDRVKAVLAFSPIECLKGIIVAQQIASLNKPTFVTSAKSEIEATTNIIRFVKGKYVTQFKPDVDGFHGSKTLWESVPGFETYWSALLKILAKHATRN